MSTTIQYKDFQASVTFVDGKLLLQVLHIDDVLVTECDAASEAPAALADLIDDYLETCAELGKTPSKPYKGSFNVRIPPALHRKAAMAALANDTSLNSLVADAIEHELERYQRS